MGSPASKILTSILFPMSAYPAVYHSPHQSTHLTHLPVRFSTHPPTHPVT